MFECTKIFTIPSCQLPSPWICYGAPIIITFSDNKNTKKYQFFNLKTIWIFVYSDLQSLFFFLSTGVTPENFFRQEMARNSVDQCIA